MEQHIKLVDSLEKETTTLNLGPTHPATHGVFQNVLEVDGERIVSGVYTGLLRKLPNTGPFIKLPHLQTG